MSQDDPDVQYFPPCHNTATEENVNVPINAMSDTNVVFAKDSCDDSHISNVNLVTIDNNSDDKSNTVDASHQVFD